jgi:hypothetical protein
MTLTSHVYDSFYYKVMMIAICDMQSKDTEAQCVMWQNLNKVMMANNGVPNKVEIQTLQDSWPTMLKLIGT